MHETVSEHFLEGIMQSNDAIAEHNREHFDETGALAINIMSAPGAGKTTLLCATIRQLKQFESAVIEGDMVGELDAARLREQGIVAHQISTGRSCHLDARMIDRLLHHVDLPKTLEFLFIENVGNLVCPADFLLGEHKRIVLLSVTEGADKPLKYPVIFRNCDAVVFTKCDLLEHVEFDLEKARQSVCNINPDCRIFSLSTKTGVGMNEWIEWLTGEVKKHRSSSHG